MTSGYASNDTAPRGKEHAVPEAKLRANMCRMLIYERKLVGEMLGYSLCPDPAWDMLLDLYLALQEGRTTYVWALSVIANISKSSAHRRIASMTNAGLLIVEPDLDDRRRSCVTLAPYMVDVLNALMEKLYARFALGRI